MIVDPEQERWLKKYPHFPGVGECVMLLKRPNVSGTWVDIICENLTAHAGENAVELIAALRSEPEKGVKVLLLAALAEAGLPESVSVLAENLASDQERLQHWAEVGLRKVNTKEARTILWHHGQCLND